MTRPLPEEEVTQNIQKARSRYHRLVLVVGVAGTGKTATLMTVAGRVGTPLVNVNLELSRRMLDVGERQRPLQVLRHIDQIVAERGSDIVLLDNIEILFDAALQQHPLRLLQDLSRSRVVVAAWNGSLEGGHVHYAVPDHPEYRRYPLDGVLTVEMETNSVSSKLWPRLEKGSANAGAFISSCSNVPSTCAVQ